MLRLPPKADATKPEAYLELMAKGSFEPVFMDAGVSRERAELDAHGGRLDELLGTPAYLPPESCPVLCSDRILFGVYGPKTDVYALTLTLYVLVTGELPYAKLGLGEKRGKDHVSAVLELKRDKADPIDREKVGELFERENAAAFLEVLRAGLEPDPERRPSLQTLFRIVRDAFSVERREGKWGVRFWQGRLKSAPPSFYKPAPGAK
jgi:serine/threonine protein kinase